MVEQTAVNRKVEGSSPSLPAKLTRWELSTPEQRKKLTSNVTRWRKKKIQKLKEMFGGSCALCGYSRCFRALEFHHLDPKHKTFGISVDGRTCSWQTLIDEAKKCILLCANCHREVEEGLIDITKGVYEPISRTVA